MWPKKKRWPGSWGTKARKWYCHCASSLVGTEQKLCFNFVTKLFRKGFVTFNCVFIVVLSWVKLFPSHSYRVAFRIDKVRLIRCKFRLHTHFYRFDIGKQLFLLSFSRCIKDVSVIIMSALSFNGAYLPAENTVSASVNDIKLVLPSSSQVCIRET